MTYNSIKSAIAQRRKVRGLHMTFRKPGHHFVVDFHGFGQIELVFAESGNLR